MSALTKRPLTKKDIDIEVFAHGEKVQVDAHIRDAISSILATIIKNQSYSAYEVHGDWLDDARKRVAKYLKGVRKREALTQREVCKKLGIQQSNLSSMEQGNRPIPSSLIPKFVNLYGVKRRMIDEKLVLKKLKKNK